MRCPDCAAARAISFSVTGASGQGYGARSTKAKLRLSPDAAGYNPAIAGLNLNFNRVYLQWAPGLPKTRSGKIMRRILRKIAANEHDQLGDTSTLADPAVVDDLVEHRLIRA